LGEAEMTKSREQELKEEIEKARSNLKSVDVRSLKASELIKLNDYVDLFMKEAELKGIQEGKAEAIKDELRWLNNLVPYKTERQHINCGWEEVWKRKKKLLEKLK
jgi:hypothetical protein